jgi:hypothetical protein
MIEVFYLYTVVGGITKKAASKTRLFSGKNEVIIISQQE